jgi:hypothetical protein
LRSGPGTDDRLSAEERRALDFYDAIPTAAADFAGFGNLRARGGIKARRGASLPAAGPAIMLWYVMREERGTTRGLLPLVVGVTGHRDISLDRDSEIECHVRDLFATLQKTYPHTPIVLLSSLAEGADRLVARTALDCGAELYVVLPMQAQLYEKDFPTADSLDEFRQLMARSYGAGVIPMGHSPDARDVETPGPARDLRYAAAGAFVVSHSEILIALWDGDDDEMREMKGGTSQIVRFALQGVPATYLGGSNESLRSNETGAVYHVPVRRQSAKGEAGTLPPPSWRYPEADPNDSVAVTAARATFEENLLNLERFNRDAVSAPIARQSAVSAGSLLTPEQEATLDARDVLRYTRTLFGQADALAIRCRDWLHAATIGIFVAIGFAAMLFSLYSNVYATTASLYFAFLGVVAVAVGIDLLIVNRRMQDRFQDYRALAEGLRVQFYWGLAGIRESVYDHYFARQEGELNWIRNAMRASRFRRQAEPEREMTAERMRALLEIVLAHWINDEGSYFSGAVRRERELANRIKWGANACLVVTGIVAVALAAGIAVSPASDHGILITILTLALAGAGLFTGYAQKRAHEEHARRYRRMSALYRIAGQRVAQLLREGDLAAAQSVLVQLGREALAETCDWLLLHRERQIDVPTG